MDPEPYSRWYDYSRARAATFAAADTGFAPWSVARSDDKKRARNNIPHLLAQVSYEDPSREKVKLPKRQKPDGYRELDYLPARVSLKICQWSRSWNTPRVMAPIQVAVATMRAP
ncbi:MAG: hypothetical protein WAM94_10845 [Chromatiaceae bacterium]